MHFVSEHRNELVEYSINYIHVSDSGGADCTSYISSDSSET